MKNTLSISSDGINCTCDCVDIIADGTNSIFIALNVGNVSNPRFKLWKNNTLQSTTTLTTGITNYIEIPTALFTANAVITFQYLDNTYTGEIFTINFPNVLTGNLTVIKNSDRVYSANYTKSQEDLQARINEIETMLDCKTNTVLLATATVSTTTQSLTIENIYNYRALIFEYRIGVYTSSIVVPYVGYNTRRYMVPLIYNLTQYYSALEVYLASGTSLQATVKSYGSSWSNSNTPTLNVYGIK